MKTVAKFERGRFGYEATLVHATRRVEIAAVRDAFGAALACAVPVVAGDWDPGTEALTPTAWYVEEADLLAAMAERALRAELQRALERAGQLTLGLG